MDKQIIQTPENLKALLYKQLNVLKLEIDSSIPMVESIKMTVDSIFEYYEDFNNYIFKLDNEQSGECECISK